MNQTSSTSAWTGGGYTITWTPQMPPWPGDDGDLAGDREPRSPRPTQPPAAAALPIPEGVT